MVELKPCPWCAGTSIQAFEGSTHRWGYLACNDCGANKGDCRKADISLPATHETNLAAFALDWNTRVADKAVQASIEEKTPKECRYPFCSAANPAAINKPCLDCPRRGGNVDSALAPTVGEKDVQRFADQVGLRYSLVPPSPGPSFSELSRFADLVAGYVFERSQS